MGDRNVLSPFEGTELWWLFLHLKIVFVIFDCFSGHNLTSYRPSQQRCVNHQGDSCVQVTTTRSVRIIKKRSYNMLKMLLKIF